MRHGESGRVKSNGSPTDNNKSSATSSSSGQTSSCYPPAPNSGASIEAPRGQAGLGLGGNAGPVDPAEANRRRAGSGLIYGRVKPANSKRAWQANQRKPVRAHDPIITPLAGQIKPVHNRGVDEGRIEKPLPRCAHRPHKRPSDGHGPVLGYGVAKQKTPTSKGDWRQNRKGSDGHATSRQRPTGAAGAATATNRYRDDTATASVLERQRNQISKMEADNIARAMAASLARKGSRRPGGGSSGRPPAEVQKYTIDCNLYVGFTVVLVEEQTKQRCNTCNIWFVLSSVSRCRLKYSFLIGALFFFVFLTGRRP